MNNPSPVMPYPVLMGQVIQAHRKRRGLQQNNIAGAIGLSPSAYSRIETGDTSMTISQLRATARALGVRPSVLCAEVEGYVQQLEGSGVSVPDVKAANPAALLIGLGLLAALLATAKG